MVQLSMEKLRWIKKRVDRYQVQTLARWALAILILVPMVYLGLRLTPATEQKTSAPRPADIQRVRLEAQKCLESGTTGEQVLCLNRLLRNVSKTQGARAALDIIEPISQKSTYLLRSSHPFAHTIGTNALFFHREVQGASSEGAIGRALTECDGFGAFGCYHGVIEAGLSLIPVGDRASTVRKACMEDPLIQKTQYYVNQCLHWFGHGLAIFTNLPLEEALQACEGLSEKFLSDNVQLCLSGVFHAGTVPGEADNELLHNVENVWKKGDPYYPCLAVEEKFRGHCFSHAAGRSRSPSLEVQFRTCNNIPEQDPQKRIDYINGCYESVANPLMSMALSQEGLSEESKVQKIINDCRLYSMPEHRRFCYAGAARYWVLFNPLLSNLGPFKICQGIEEEAKTTCYANIGFGNNENYYSEEKLKEYCSHSEPDYIDDCIRRHVRLL